MGIPDFWVAVGLILGIIEQVRAKGQDLLAWAIIVIAIGFLWHLVPT
jgi:hypothetical protein